MRYITPFLTSFRAEAHFYKKVNIVYKLRLALQTDRFLFSGSCWGRADGVFWSRETSFVKGLYKKEVILSRGAFPF